MMSSFYLGRPTSDGRVASGKVPIFFFNFFEIKNGFFSYTHALVLREENVDSTRYPSLGESTAWSLNGDGGRRVLVGNRGSPRVAVLRVSKNHFSVAPRGAARGAPVFWRSGRLLTPLPGSPARRPLRVRRARFVVRRFRVRSVRRAQLRGRDRHLHAGFRRNVLDGGLVLGRVLHETSSGRAALLRFHPGTRRRSAGRDRLSRLLRRIRSGSYFRTAAVQAPLPPGLHRGMAARSRYVPSVPRNCMSARAADAMQDRPFFNFSCIKKNFPNLENKKPILLCA